MTMTMENTMVEIVEAYNNLTDLKVKKFSTKAEGLKRLTKIQKTETDFTSEVLSVIESKSGLFTPTEVDIKLPNDEVIPDKKAIVDKDSGEYVSTVGKSYQLISNREVFTEFSNVLKESGLDTTGMIVTPVITKSKCYVKFQFPAHRVEIKPNDFIDLMITARNSYDGTSRFTLDIGGFRLLCSNGMGIGRYTNVYSNKHSSGFSHNKMAAYLSTAVEVFTTAGEEWQQMTKEEISKEQALEVLSIMTEKKTKLTFDEVLEGKQTKLKAALQEFERYVKEMGMNRFALLNTVTHLSTHVSTEKGNIVGLLVYKDKLRDKALDSNAFKVRKVA